MVLPRNVRKACARKPMGMKQAAIGLIVIVWHKPPCNIPTCVMTEDTVHCDETRQLHSCSQLLPRGSKSAGQPACPGCANWRRPGEARSTRSGRPAGRPARPGWASCRRSGTCTPPARPRTAASSPTSGPSSSRCLSQALTGQAHRSLLSSLGAST